jgi:hypothetical protein
LRLSLIQSLSLTEARCRFGKYLQCNLQENIQGLEEIIQMDSVSHHDANTDFQSGNTAKGLGIRVVFQLKNCEAEIALGDKIVFIPSEEGVQNLINGPLQGKAFIAYD